MRAVLSWSVLLLLFPVLVACSGRQTSDGGSPPGPDAGAAACSGNAVQCAGYDVQRCVAGTLQTIDHCDLSQQCVDGLGCRACIPGRMVCVGNEVHVCDDTGNGSTLQSTCAADEICQAGACVNACAAARAEQSTVGCDYYAADLDNGYGEGVISGGAFPNASESQYAVVLANPSDVAVMATVTTNEADPGAPVSEHMVGQYPIAPQGLARIDLPAREVDGSTMADNGPGTFLSSQAYRIQTDYPVVAYQFNTIVQSYSSDASTLIPVAALGTKYRGVAHTSANPLDESFLGLPPQPGVPDHGFLTIIGTAANTHVHVTVNSAIVGGGGIPETEKGGTVDATLGPYDVLNLETRPLSVSEVMGGELADLTGSVVESDQPVAVFGGAERATVVPPSWMAPEGNDGCCAEHLEEQMLPTTAWGKRYAVPHSPIRSSMAAMVEPDVYRIMADQDGTTVHTNLPAPNDVIHLDEDQWVELGINRSFTADADRPISITQLLVSQDVVGTSKPGNDGDPAMIMMPAVEQYRDNYVFLVPDTFQSDYVVISRPVGTRVELDGSDTLDGCVVAPIGGVNGVGYESVTCLLPDGRHTVRGEQPIGIFVYGYDNAGSYGYFGGSNIQNINPLI